MVLIDLLDGSLIDRSNKVTFYFNQKIFGDNVWQNVLESIELKDKRCRAVSPVGTIPTDIFSKVETAVQAQMT